MNNDPIVPIYHYNEVSNRVLIKMATYQTLDNKKTLQQIQSKLPLLKIDFTEGVYPAIYMEFNNKEYELLPRKNNTESRWFND